jgi:signal transduction histidine kinase
MKRKLGDLWRMLFAPSPLRRKFLRAFLAVGLVPLLLMGLLSIYLLNLIHRIDITELEQNLARQTSIEVRKSIDSVVENVQLEVTSERFIPVAEQQFILERLLERSSALSELAFVCTNPEFCQVGQVTSQTKRSNVATSTLPSSYVGNPLFETVRAGKTFIGSVDLTSSPLTTFAAGPVFDKNRAIISGLVGKFTLDLIQTIVQNNRLGSTGYVYIVDDRGMIIAHPQQEFIGIPLTEAAKAPKAYLNPQPMVGTATNEIYESFGGQMVSGVTARIPDMHWNVIAEWPREETQAVIRSMVLNVIQFSLGSLVLILIIGGIMTSGLIRPISTLKQGVQAIGQGNLSYRFHLGTHDELEELGGRLNVMAEDLKSLQELHELQVRTQTLSESLRKEQELSSLKDQFVRTVSHQFNTPLSVIHWALEMIHGEDTNAETLKEGLASINQSRKDILAMVDNLLTLSEIGFRYEKKNEKIVDFRKLVGDAITKLHEDISMKNLTIRFTENGSDLTAKVNDFAMSKVIENLISNAVNYSHQGAKVDINLTTDAQALTFKIADHGIGIPTEEQKSIFQQFFRASNAIDKKNVGTGVGLFIAKTIIDGHGGKIWFESKKDQGTTFYFSLPRA